MPPINQGSRAALITWTVIMSVLFVVVTVLAFLASSNATASEERIATERAKYEKVVSENDLAGPVVTELGTAKETLTTAGKANASTTLINVAVTERNDLAARIAAGVTNSAAAVAASDASLAAVKAATGTPAAPASLTEAITVLVKELDSAKAQIAAAAAEKADALKQIETLTVENTTQIAAKDAEIAAAQAEVAKATEAATADRGSKDTQVADIVKSSAEQAAQYETSMTAVSTQVAQLTSQIKAKDAQIAALNDKLGFLRVDVGQVSKQVDGTIIKTPGSNVVYINLGSGDQVSPGMTFEVFDRLDGVPPIGNPGNDDALPKGKASIEITRVQAGSSECRIVRTAPGQTVVEGDLLVNVVYDKNIKYKFVVYGNFDLDRNGNSTATDTDVMKRLVTQWGATVADKLNAETDFLVIGSQPVVPNFTEEELANPINQAQKEKAEADLKAFDDLIARAVELRIPILNQNRFLYFTGYYQQSAQ